MSHHQVLPRQVRRNPKEIKNFGRRGRALERKKHCVRSEVICSKEPSPILWPGTPIEEVAHIPLHPITSLYLSRHYFGEVSRAIALSQNADPPKLFEWSNACSNCWQRGHTQIAGAQNPSQIVVSSTPSPHP